VTDDLGPPRWRGERGRTEVWYATFTDHATGLGGWVHHETVAPTDDRPPYAHGWAAVFPADGPARVERFGPAPIEPGPANGDVWHAVDGCFVGPGRLQGRAGTLAWDLAFADDGPPLFTFPEAVWRRELLPGAQIVPWSEARFTGSLVVDGVRSEVDARGAVARIHGHGNANRWGWLHADLDGGGAVEIVAAQARRPGLRRLPPLALVQVRLPGRRDWPRNPLAAAPLLRTRLRPDGFAVRGRVGRARLDVDVRLPAEQSVALAYTDPDGATATCTNSERASASIRLRGPGVHRHWELAGTAHAEVGTRP